MTARHPEGADLVAVLRDLHPTFDTPSQHALFAAPSVQRTIASGQRSARTLWCTHDRHGAVNGLLGGRLLGEFALIDLLSLPPDPAQARALVSAATAWARTHPEAEVSFGAPARDDPLREPAVASVVELLATAGWRVLVTRSHYEVPAAGPAATAPEAPPLRPLVLEPAGPQDLPRITAAARTVLPGSLDVRDNAAVREHGLERAAELMAEELIEADPIECVRFAVHEGRDVALASWRAMPDGRGFLGFVGVAQEHRGQGLARALARRATQDLIASGSTTLIADTDDGNIPMRRAFSAAGWDRTESRIDLVLADQAGAGDTR